MSNLAIKHTMHPDGFKEPYLNGMPKPERHEGLRIFYMNRVRPGGIAYCDLDPIEQANRILKLKAII